MLRRASSATRKGPVDFFYHLGEGRGSRGRHQHEGHQISVTVGGNARMQWWTSARGEACLYPRDGHVLINPAGEPHSSEWSGSWDCIGFYVPAELTASVAEQMHVPCTVAPQYNSHDRAVYGVARSLLDEIDADPLGCRLYADSVAQFLAVRLVLGGNFKQPEASPHALSATQMRRLAEFIGARIDTNFSSADLAAEIDLSVFHFSRRFRATTGFTPYQYVIRERIGLARELLANTRLPIAEISSNTGFSSQSHLSAKFRKIVGVTPRRYREQS